MSKHALKVEGHPASTAKKRKSPKSLGREERRQLAIERKQKQNELMHDEQMPAVNDGISDEWFEGDY